MVAVLVEPNNIKKMRRK